MHSGFLIYVATFLIMVSCTIQRENDTLLLRSRQKLRESTSVSYDFVNQTNNLFNSTNYSDSGNVTYFKVKNGIDGFGLYAKQRQIDYLFDGLQFEKFKHQDKIQIMYDEEEIQNDSTYFENLPFFTSNPFNILNAKSFEKFTLTKTNEQGLLVYKDEHRQTSKSDSTKKVTYQKCYFLDKKSKEVIRIIDRTILEKDTLQVVDWHYTNYKYGKFNSNIIDSLKSLNYTQLSPENEYDELEYKSIKVGDKLEQQTYKDSKGNDIKIYGNEDKLSLIIFSLIGCAPCEMALKDLSLANNNIRKDVDIFYSSFQNNHSALKKYLNKKDISYISFGSESNLLSNFGMYHSPSFVIINTNGEVMKIIEGYEKAKKDELFQFLLSK